MKSHPTGLAAPTLFLPVVARELSVASRRPSTYSRRMGTAVLAIGAAAAVFLVLFQTTAGEQGRMLFRVLSGLAFAYSLLAGVRSTSDCVSSEKRDGTLGLLFLTDLKGYDVVFGKLVSSSVAAFYGLLAMIPILGLAMMLGGVSGGELFRVALVLLNTLFMSLAAGVFVSTVSRVERKALSATLGLVLLITFGPYPVAYYYAYGFGGAGLSVDTTFLISSPFYAFELTRITAASGLMVQDFYRSLLAAHLIGWSLLALAAVILPRTFKERPRGVRGLRWWERWQRWSYGSRAVRQAFRTKLLKRNPFFWLAGRDRLKANYVWLFLGLLGCLWYLLFSSEPEVVLDCTVSAWWLFFLVGFLKVWFASEVCARLFEDRRCGALELLLTSPLSIKEIAKGQALALRRQFAKPLAFILAASVALLLAGLQSRLFYANKTEIIAMYAAGMILLVADVITLKWVGMWQALTSKSAGRALIATSVRVLSLPWITFGICYFATLFLFAFSLQRRMDVARLHWVTTWFAIGIAMDLVFGLWARQKVLREFRSAATRSIEAGEMSEGLARSVAKLVGDAAAGLSALRTPGRWACSKSLVRRYRWIMSMAAVLVLVIGGFAWHRYSLARRLQARLADLRAANYPVTAAELDRWQPTVPDKENAALKILEAAAATAIDPMAFGRIESIGRIAVLPPDLKLALGRLLSSNAVPLRLVHEAVCLSGSRYPVDWSNAAAFRFQQLSRVHQLLPLLRAEALLHSDAGDPARAAESIVVSFRLAHTLATEFNSTAEWVRLACLSMACSSLEQVLAQHALSEPDLQRLLTLVAGAEHEPKPGRMLAGQRAVDLAAYYLPPARLFQAASPNITRQQVNAFGFFFGVLRITGIRESDAIFYVDGVDRWIAITGLEYPERLTKAKELDLQLERQLTYRPHFFLSRKLISLGESEVSLAEQVAYLRAAQTALAVECCRSKNNRRLPESLDELVPGVLSAVPNDPFDGRPLRFKPLENGCVVYSIGADGNDDGGKEIKLRNRGVSNRDITFTVER